MSTKTKSMFSGMGALIGTLAGLVTVAVGVLTIGSQLGWFDSKSDNAKTDTGTETPAGDQRSGASQSSGGGGSAAAAAPEYAVSPEKVSFSQLDATPKIITVTNEGSAPFSVDAPQLEGSNPDQFEVEDVSCNGAELQRGRSCQVRVKFAATKGGDYDAEVVIPVSGSGSDPEVPVEGEKIL